MLIGPFFVCILMDMNTIAFFNVADYAKPIIEKNLTKHGLKADLFEFELANASETLDVSKYEIVSLAPMFNISNEMLDRLSTCKLIALRTVGYQYIDLKYASSKGITVTNARYESTNVADFTIMLILIALRKAKISICKALVNDFSLVGMMGKELHSMKVGVIGTGKIGSQVIKELKGFGSEILCYDPHKNKTIEGLARYTTLEEIYKTCDIISFHCPLTKDNYHMVSYKEIAMMKKGVIIVNTARGPLLDVEALIDGIESLRIGSLALDTIEGEDGVSHVDIGTEVDGLARKKSIMYLKQFANVLITQHYGFFTEEAVTAMIDCAFDAIEQYRNSQPILNKVN